MSDSKALKVVDALQGSNFLAVSSALPVFERHGLKLPPYKISVVAEGNFPIILFAAGDPKEADRKCFAVRADSNLALTPAEACGLYERIQRLRVLDSLQGSSVPPIQRAVAVFRDRNGDIAQYKITLMNEGDVDTVSFSDKTAQPGVRGSSGAHPGFEVTMSAADLRVLKSYFIR